MRRDDGKQSEDLTHSVGLVSSDTAVRTSKMAQRTHSMSCQRSLTQIHGAMPPCGIVATGIACLTPAANDATLGIRDGEREGGTAPGSGEGLLAAHEKPLLLGVTGPGSDTGSESGVGAGSSAWEANDQALLQGASSTEPAVATTSKPMRQMCVSVGSTFAAIYNFTNIGYAFTQMAKAPRSFTTRRPQAANLLI